MNDTKPNWNPRVPRHKVWQLYHNDALGLQDDDMVNDVGMTLLLRVESCLTVSEAQHGRVKCPVCGTVIVRDNQRRRQRTTDLVACTKCDWQLSWFEYRKTFHNKQLGCGGMFVPCQEFAKEYPKARTYQEKMILIDTLIHRFHWQMEGRPGNQVLQ